VTVPATLGPSPAGRLQELSSEIGSAVELMVKYFGPPPLKTLTVSPIPGVFGQGFPGLVYLSTMAYLNPTDRPPGWQSESSRVFFSELLHAHEAAHQWWGNLVTSASYQDEWLMEALANYTAMMVLEKRKGRRALDAVLDEYRNNLLARSGEKTIESYGPIIWGVRLVSSQAPSAWRTITYEKGSWIMHMLRMRLGEDAFTRMLGEIVKRKRLQAITTAEFRDIAATFLQPKSEDPKLENFFEQWVYSTGVPTLKLKYSVQGKAPKIRLRGEVEQADAPEEFSALVPIEIQLPGRQTVTRWIRTGSDAAQFTVDLKQAPIRVLLDPANAVLAKKN
jgi:aminopeptidase N